MYIRYSDGLKCFAVALDGLKGDMNLYFDFVQYDADGGVALYRDSGSGQILDAPLVGLLFGQQAIDFIEAFKRVEK